MNQMKRLPLLAAIAVLLLATAFATAAFAQTPDPQKPPPAACPMTEGETACPMAGKGQAACPMVRGAGVCPAMRGNGVCPAHAGQDGAAACPMADGMQGMMSGMMRGQMPGTMWGAMRDMMGRFGMMGRFDLERGWNAPQSDGQGPAWRMPGGRMPHAPELRHNALVCGQQFSERDRVHSSFTVIGATDRLRRLLYDWPSISE